eukprot:m.445809 g.445809  ORF g.445809 m.445809 type:complete len:51 (+) comp19278_c0_seq1:3699-3851(+)
MFSCDPVVCLLATEVWCAVPLAKRTHYWAHSINWAATPHTHTQLDGAKEN